MRIELRTNIEYLKKQSIDMVFLDALTRDILHNKYGVETVEDLLKVDSNLLKSDKDLPYWNLRKRLMERGIILENDKREYESFGIKEDIALTSLLEINMSKKIASAFRRKKGIYFLGDVLKLDYSEIEDILYNNVSLINEFKEVIHYFGYHFINEKNTWIEEVNLRRKKGIKLIEEELGIRVETAQSLYKNGIFTLDELIEFGVRKIHNLNDIGTNRYDEICDAVRLKYQGNEEMLEKIFSRKKDKSKLLKTKEELLKEYERLIEEREKLEEKERQIDQKILEITNMLVEVNNGRK